MPNYTKLILPVFQDFRNNFDFENDGKQNRISYNLKEIDLIKKSSYEEGFLEGLNKGILQGNQEALNDYQYQINLLLTEICSDIQKQIELMNNYKEKFFATVTNLSLKIVKKLFPLLKTEREAKELEDRILYILSTLLTDNQKIVLSLHPEHADKLGENLKVFAESQKIDLTLDYSSSLDTYAFSTKWDGGGALWNPEEILNDIEHAFINYQPEQIQEETNG